MTQKDQIPISPLMEIEQNLDNHMITTTIRTRYDGSELLQARIQGGGHGGQSPRPIEMAP